MSSHINRAVLVLHKEKTQTINFLVEAFSKDITTYYKGNSGALSDARSNLKMRKTIPENSPPTPDEAIENALTVAMLAGGKAFYIPAHGVKFADQPAEDLKMWVGHTNDAIKAFQDALEASGAWDKRVISEKEKQDRANLKAAKELEVINKAIEARGLVDAKTIRPFTTIELLEQAQHEIVQGNCTKSQLMEVYKVTMSALANIHKAEQLALARANMAKETTTA